MALSPIALRRSCSSQTANRAWPRHPRHARATRTLDVEQLAVVRLRPLDAPLDVLLPRAQIRLGRLASRLCLLSRPLSLDLPAQRGLLGRVFELVFGLSELLESLLGLVAVVRGRLVGMHLARKHPVSLDHVLFVRLLDG
eukprot:829339-Prymnesium_polylepis.1